MDDRSWRCAVRFTLAVGAGLAPAVVGAQTPATLSGPPVQVTPYAPEPGVPLITISPGAVNPFAGSTDPSAGSGGSAPTSTTATASSSGSVASGGTATGPTSGAMSVGGSGTALTYTNADGTTTTVSGGSMAWRNNNPGNLVYNSYTASLGAIGSNNGFAVFPDAATGTTALTSLLNGSTYQSLSVNAAIARYAPAFENNTTAYQSFVTGSLGVSGSTPLSSLSQSQMQTLQTAIQTQEGYITGTVTND